MLAAIRPDSVNFPLFLHVLGAMLMVGVLLSVGTSLIMSRRAAGEAQMKLTRFGLKTLLYAAFPTWLLMRVGAQWTESEENLPDAVQDSAWLGVGYITAELGGLLIIVSMVLSGIGLRKLAAGGGSGQARTVAYISLFLIGIYLITIWAMSAKPE